MASACTLLQAAQRGQPGTGAGQGLEDSPQLHHSCCTPQNTEIHDFLSLVWALCSFPAPLGSQRMWGCPCREELSLLVARCGTIGYLITEQLTTHPSLRQICKYRGELECTGTQQSPPGGVVGEDPLALTCFQEHLGFQEP